MSDACIVAAGGQPADAGGPWRLEETASCRTPACATPSAPLPGHPAASVRHGRPASGNGQCVRCETGGRKLLEALPVRLHKTHRSLADDVFSRIADKSPVHAPVRGAPPTSVRAY